MSAEPRAESPPAERDPLRRLLLDQLSIGSALLDYHLQQLTEEDLFWSAAPLTWTMHRAQDGWQPDWAETEPIPVPVPTVAWLTWHVGWWWTTATAHLSGGPVPERSGIQWPGAAAATVEWLRGIHDEYRAALSGPGDLDRDSGFPWPPGSGRTMADLAAWVNVELTKNAAEIGQLLLIRRATTDRHLES